MLKPSQIWHAEQFEFRGAGAGSSAIDGDGSADEGRNPKAEGRKKPEFRNSKAEAQWLPAVDGEDTHLGMDVTPFSFVNVPKRTEGKL